MAGHHRHGKLRAENIESYPWVYVEKGLDYASIKIAPGVEAMSYVKDGVVFCEDAKGKVIEIQILNLSRLARRKAVA